METFSLDLRGLSDADLIARVQTCARDECRATSTLIAALAEIDARRLYLGQGCSSLFTYCTQVLHLSEHAAYGRIEAARASRKFPLVLQLLAEGEVTLTTITLLAAYLTAENHRELLESARHKSKRDVEYLAAALRPLPAVPTMVRKLPVPKPPPTPPSVLATTLDAPPTERTLQGAAPARPAVATPLAPERYKIQFTASRETYDKLRRAQEQLRHRIPSGDIAEIVDRALTLLLADIDRKTHASVQRPRAARQPNPASRHIAADVKRMVWARDAGRCAFVGAAGRCTERAFLEFHHVRPFVEGGDGNAGNIELRCRAHNRYEAEQYFWTEQPPT